METDKKGNRKVGSKEMTQRNKFMGSADTWRHQSWALTPGTSVKADSNKQIPVLPGQQDIESLRKITILARLCHH